MSKQYPIANLSDKELTKLKQAEQDLRAGLDKDVILIAYQDTDGGQHHD
ncbi:hypothetical protein [Bacillus solimangrovi]|nr:hypothetical protein [Bacillus solimangrovi]